MRKIYLGFLLLTIWCCKNRVNDASSQFVSNREEPLRPCEIVLIQDTTDKHFPFVTEINFKCDSIKSLIKLNFYQDNPWRNDSLQILPEENPFRKFGNQYDKLLKQGFISYDLHRANWSKIQDVFNIHSELPLDSLWFANSWSDCRFKVHLPNYALTNYWLEIRGSKDSLQTKFLSQFILQNQTKVYNNKGEIVYEITRDNLAFTGTDLDSTCQYLFTRYWRQDMNNNFSGFEIHDLQKKVLIEKFERDSTFTVYSPLFYGNYVVFEVKKRNFSTKKDQREYLNYEVYVYDVANKQLLRKNLGKNYSFFFSGVASEYLIFTKGDDEGTPIVYDSIPISSLGHFHTLGK